MNPFERALVDLGLALVKLFEIMRGDSHGILQGTHEAVLFEAQGGQMGPRGFSHLQSLRQTAADIQIRQDALISALNRLSGLDSALGGRIRAITDPVLRLSGEYLRAAAHTERAAVALRQTDATRFQGVMLGQGGLGPEIGRTSRALITNQLNQMSTQLTARGIESRLIPATRPALQSVMFAIRQLPVQERDAMARLSLVLAAMRGLLSVAAQQAFVAGRAAVAAALLGLEQVLTRIASGLNIPVFFFMFPGGPEGLFRELDRALGRSDDIQG